MKLFKRLLKKNKVIIVLLSVLLGATTMAQALDGTDVLLQVDKNLNPESTRCIAS